MTAGGETEEERRNREHFERNQAIDPRLTWQDEYLSGAELHWRRWHAPKPSWDHDHCEFCWAKFVEEIYPEDPHRQYYEGYLTWGTEQSPRRECWICPMCFEDFKERFGWTVIVD